MKDSYRVRLGRFKLGVDAIKRSGGICLRRIIGKGKTSQRLCPAPIEMSHLEK